MKIFYVLTQYQYHWEMTLSKSHERKTFKRIKRQVDGKFMTKLLTLPTILDGETFRWRNKERFLIIKYKM